jgi:predicted transcriptional regulator
MLNAIQQYVRREEARESFRQEAQASWVACQETGRHLSGQEVRAWLNTWGTEDERAAPECHE